MDIAQRERERYRLKEREIQRLRERERERDTETQRETKTDRQIERDGVSDRETGIKANRGKPFWAITKKSY